MVLALIEWKVCLTLTFQPKLSKLHSLRCLWHWILLVPLNCWSSSIRTQTRWIFFSKIDVVGPPLQVSPSVLPCPFLKFICKLFISLDIFPMNFL
uniref:Macaca fascicularis brain cDNA clone: QflA-16926, similar to human hypothetical gene supported by AK095077 (LOC401284), mRNA, RefSeq: XM_379454.1 n=1 Tax=Macaca fascicularis TaxID=9541 RepID=I7GBK1_MACFA|nr:unnamed protein product [Macaca fascicularis]